MDYFRDHSRIGPKDDLQGSRDRIGRRLHWISPSISSRTLIITTPIMETHYDQTSQVAIAIDPPRKFAIDNPAYHDGSDGKTDVERLSCDDISESSSCSCSGDDCCNRRYSSFLHDKKAACRSCAASSREFVAEVGELIGSVDVRRRAKRLFTLQTVLDTFPITKWLPKYRSVLRNLFIGNKRKYLL